ncbi:MAG: DUF1987 domain-containing protein [Bacteroidetes bacterium]|nr:DUF1987 domain-containing protein [Bacteroidota bacterium]
MEALFIQATEDTPLVDYNIEKNSFSISERSYPENAVDFYAPVITWVEELLSQTEQKSYVFDFDFEYLNTASSKQIIKMLLTIEKFIEKHDITIRWFYEKGDDDMLALGRQYSKFLKLPFEVVEKK